MDADIKALTEATSGAFGGVLSTTILYPLDTCKTKFQAEANADGPNKYRNLLDVLREAVSCGKVLSLYQGLATKNGHAVLAGFVYFYSYSYIRTKYLEHAQAQKLGTLANLVVAAAAGACTACATQPLDTLSARMQTSRPGEAKGLLHLLREGGIKRAFDGLGISLILTMNPAIQYTVFEQLKTRLLERERSKHMLSGRSSSPPPEALTAFTAFLLGAISKCVATVLTYPLIRCKVIMQRAVTQEEEERRRLAGGDVAAGGPPETMLKALKVIWRSEGLPGFYKGLDAQILKTVLSAALMLMIKEKVTDGSRATVLALHRIVSSIKAPHARAAAAPAGPGVAVAPARSGTSGSLPTVDAPTSAVASIHPSIRVIPVKVSGHGAGSGVHHLHVLATDEGVV